MGAPHLRIPFFVGATDAAEVVEQDTPDEIAQCVQVLISTTIGQRIEIPDYGVPDSTFVQETDVQIGAIVAAVAKWEPRASVQITSVPDSLDELLRQLSVKVRPAGG
jgi:phage baseplate assembly protein W